MTSWLKEDETETLALTQLGLIELQKAMLKAYSITGWLEIPGKGGRGWKRVERGRRPMPMQMRLKGNK